jgi:hypothetical protein
MLTGSALAGLHYRCVQEWPDERSGVPRPSWPDAPSACIHPGQGKRAAPAVVRARERGIPLLLAAASKIHADPHEPSDARQSQGGP